jgi:hypothetical protein
LFVLTVFVYPLVLALLCLGAGLLVDRCSGGFLPAALLPVLGAAALIALSQLSTYAYFIAPATPYLMVVVALIGFVLGRARLLLLARRLRSKAWLKAVPVLAYLLAIAPVLLAGRASFSSFMALSDSAVHLIGADFFIHHGQHYAHLDLHNSYGLFIHNYYDTSYPSGADTLFGGSALLLGLPLIWAFQPFVAFMLAIACGPAWLLARQIGLRGVWAALAALSATLPALVYAYELIGSVKEIVAVPMILTLGVLVVTHRRWLFASANRAIPFALVLSAGVSALGVGFGAWVLAAVAILGLVVIGELRAGRASARAVLMIIGAGALVTLIAAWPTWVNISGSVHVAQAIAATSNPGNLQSPLHWTQVFGVWLHGSYKESPSAAALTFTDVLIALTLAACAVGALRLLRVRRYALAGWFALMLLVWVVLSRYATTWVQAKALMISSPIVVLIAWGAVAALRASPGSSSARLLPRIAATALALALAGGMLASDAVQYHSSNLAPTARYEELSHINKRFAGRGPVLFTDFDEYSLYVLRDLDVGGPDFVYPPPALADIAGGYGQPVVLSHAEPQALDAYPLIITRRDPSAPPPPAAYRLLWQGDYYEVWGRIAGARARFFHFPASSKVPLSCARIEHLVTVAKARRSKLVIASAPELVPVSLAHVKRPAGWGRERKGLAMKRPGTVSSGFTLPRAGLWNLWLQGQFMPQVTVRIDGRLVSSVSGQLSGNSLVPDTTPPVAVRLSAGTHRLTVTRSGSSLAPGNDGAAVLDSVFLTPAGAPTRELIEQAPGANSRSLCGRPYEWIEIVPE